MSKKSKLTLKTILYSVAVVLGVVSICMMFASAFAVTQSVTILGQTAENVTVYTGVQAVFGKEDVLAFSFMNLLSYILVLVGAVFAVLKACGVLKSKIFDYVIIALFVVAALFFFLTVQLLAWNETTKSILDVAQSTYSLGAGPIVSAILSLCSAACVGVACTRKK